MDVRGSVRPILAVLLAVACTPQGAARAAATPGQPPAPEPTDSVKVRPTSFHRGLPESFHDQAVDSVKALHPDAEFVERVRADQIGDLSYALVAWKRDARSERVEVSAVAVKGERAWELELSPPASAYPAARNQLMDRLSDLSGPEKPPKAEVVVRTKGRAVSVSAQSVRDLVTDAEVLVASCSNRTDDEPEASPPQLELTIRYAQPRRLGLGLRGQASVELDEIRIAADESRNAGWPTERVRHGGRETGLGQCDGTAILRLLCRPELRPHAPAAVTRNCRSAYP